MFNIFALGAMTQLVRWIRDASIAGWKLFPTPLWCSQEHLRISGRSAVGSDHTKKPQQGKGMIGFAPEVYSQDILGMNAEGRDVFV